MTLNRGRLAAPAAACLRTSSAGTASRRAICQETSGVISLPGYMSPLRRCQLRDRWADVQARRSAAWRPTTLRPLGAFQEWPGSAHLD